MFLPSRILCRLSSSAILKLVSVFLSCWLHVEANASQLTAVVRPGATVPSEAGLHFTRFASPSINSAGVITFIGHFADGTGVETGNGVWVATGNGLRTVVLSGSQAPEVPSGITFREFSGAVTSRFGRTAVVGGVKNLAEDNLTPKGIWAEHGGALELVVADGGSGLSSPPDKTISFATWSTFTPSGIVGFAGNGDAILMAGNSVYRHRQGQTPDEIPLSAFPSTFPSNPSLLATSFSAPVGSGFDPTLSVSPSGRIAHYGRVLYLSGVGQSRLLSGIWTGTFDSMSPVAIESQVAPGIPGALTFTSFRNPDVNDSGEAAFVGKLNTISHSDRGVWVGKSTDTLRLVAWEGTQASSLPTGVKFRDFLPPVINVTGRTAFIGSWLNEGAASQFPVGSGTAIWSDGSGELQIIAREGQQAPGCPEGIVFQPFFGTSNVNPSISPTSRLVLNGRGQAAFTSELSLTVQLGGPNIGIFAQDQKGEVKLIARTGQTIDLGDGVDRIISRLDFQGYSGNQDGRVSGFSDDGAVVFAAQFTDGTAAVVVSRAVAIPEPTPLILASLGFVLIARIRAPSWIALWDPT